MAVLLPAPSSCYQVGLEVEWVSSRDPKAGELWRYKDEFLKITCQGFVMLLTGEDHPTMEIVTEPFEITNLATYLPYMQAWVTAWRNYDVHYSPDVPMKPSHPSLTLTPEQEALVRSCQVTKGKDFRKIKDESITLESFNSVQTNMDVPISIFSSIEGYIDIMKTNKFTFTDNVAPLRGSAAQSIRSKLEQEVQKIQKTRTLSATDLQLLNLWIVQAMEQAHSRAVHVEAEKDCQAWRAAHPEYVKYKSSWIPKKLRKQPLAPDVLEQLATEDSNLADNALSCKIRSVGKFPHRNLPKVRFTSDDPSNPCNIKPIIEKLQKKLPFKVVGSDGTIKCFQQQSTTSPKQWAFVIERRDFDQEGVNYQVSRIFRLSGSNEIKALCQTIQNKLQRELDNVWAGTGTVSPSSSSAAAAAAPASVHLSTGSVSPSPSSSTSQVPSHVSTAIPTDELG